MSNSKEVLAVEVEQEVSALPVIPAKFSDESLIALFNQVADEVRSEVPDISTKAGRARIKSLASKVSRSKTALDKPMRDHLRELKSLPKILEKSARENVERFDALRDELLEPMAEQKKWHDDLMAFLLGMECACTSEGATSESISNLISELEKIESCDFDMSESGGFAVWDEMRKKVKDAHSEAKKVCELNLYRIKDAEREAAELEAFRLAALKKQEEERVRQIAEQAAAEATRAAEEKARIAREEAERRELEEKRKAEFAEQEKIKAEQAAIAAKKYAEEMKARAEAEAEETKLRMERMRIEAEQAAERAKQEAKERAKREAAQAVEREKQRVAAEKAEAERAEKAREADKNHKAAVNRAALAALVAAGVSDEQAKIAIRAIARGDVPSIKISY